jgi:hypothetical protein
MHKFKIGQTVELLQTRLNRGLSARDYKVLRLLPEILGEYSYQVRSASEPHERVVKESELRRRTEY